MALADAGQVRRGDGGGGSTDADLIASIEHLSVRFPRADWPAIKALDDICLDIRTGEILGVVGESGSGKTMFGLSLLGLVPAPGVTTGSVRIGGVDVVSARRRDLYSIRGRRVGLVLQDPTASLNPLRTIGSQMHEAARGVVPDRKAASREIARVLERVGLDPRDVLRRRPFELSGGMNQRIAIAMALIRQPDILVADEPTTALDAVVQLDVLRLLASLRDERAMAIVLISHDLSVVSSMSDRVAVFYAGKLVEFGEALEVTEGASHPYTEALLAAAPKMSASTNEFAPIKGQFRAQQVGDDGCPFVSRCQESIPECAAAFPLATELSGGHSVWCWARQAGGSDDD